MEATLLYFHFFMFLEVIVVCDVVKSEIIF